MNENTSWNYFCLKRHVDLAISNLILTNATTYQNMTFLNHSDDNFTNGGDLN